jgi:hypothetical protein
MFNRDFYQEITSIVTADQCVLQGCLVIPTGASGLAICGYGGGSHRYYTDNQAIAHMLHQVKLATLTVNLLTSEEELTDLRTRHFHFDILLLANRLWDVTMWLRQHPLTDKLKLGYFGADTIGSAVLTTAANHPKSVNAVVLHSGRTDFVSESILSTVEAPTLLIAGEHDLPGRCINEDTLASLYPQKQLVIIPNAAHHCNAPGTLEVVAQLTGEWFNWHFNSRAKRTVTVQ